MRRRKRYGAGRFAKALSALLVTAAIAAAVVFAAPEAVSKYRRSEADKAVSEGRTERAIELLLPELERDAKNTGLRLEIVELYVSAGNFSRAEYLLAHGMRELGGQTELYRRLCAIYVTQDKLYDAVNLLNNLQNPFVRDALSAERPEPPVFDPPPGDFREALTVSVSCGQGDVIYLALDGGVPGARDLYTGPVEMPQGVTELRAVAVSPEGLVSDWALAAYRLDDVLEPVIFEDSLIEQAARALLGMPSGAINSGHLQTVKELELSEAAAYGTLNDLRHFTHLERLSLTGADTYADISALAGLTRLTSLTLRDFGIDSFNLETVGQMTWLTELNLPGNRLVSIDQLAALVNLEKLTLNDNNILYIQPLSGLSALKVLVLSRNAVEDTSALAPLTGIEILKLDDNLVRALNGLANMTSLTELDLSGNSIVNVEPLRSLESLETLNLSANRDLHDISSVGELKKLIALSADGCGIVNVEGLSGLTAMKTLSLNENLLVNLVGLEGAESLTVLWVNKNEIISLRALSNLPNLAELHVEHNKLPSLVAIKDMKSLKQVFAFGNPITENVAFGEGVSVIVGR